MIKSGVCILSGSVALAAIALCLLAFSGRPTTSVASAAPAGTEDGVWTTYTTAHGLPFNSVFGGVAVDNAGRVWAGFETGEAWPGYMPVNELVSRLDGDNWVNYELPGCRVWPLAAAEDVYVGTYCPGPHSGAGGGLSWFVEETWVTFTITDGLAGDYVSAIAPEGETTVWLTTGYYLSCYDAITRLDHQGTATKADDVWTIYDDLVTCGLHAAAIDPAGARWFGGGGVWQLSADGSTWITYTSDLLVGADDFAFDAMGNTWFAAGTRVVRFDGSTWTSYDSREEAIEANYDAIMTSVNRSRVNPSGIYLPGLWAIEGQAGVWIIREESGTLEDGVGFYDGGAWSIYTHENSSLGSDDVFGLAVDQQGNVWAATLSTYSRGAGGLSKFTPWPNFFFNATPTAFLVEPGQPAHVSISLSLLRGWVSTVTLTVEGLPPAAAATFSANPVSPTAQVGLTITTAFSAPFGTYPLNVTATGAGVTRTVGMTLHVAPEVHYYYYPSAYRNTGEIP